MSTKHGSTYRGNSTARICFGILLLLVACETALSQSMPRARDLGIPFVGKTGPLNAISDVVGVEVGHTTIITDRDEKSESGPVRTGVTAIFPKGKDGRGFVFAGSFALNGTGEMTGRALIDEMGIFAGPVMITGTASVGLVRDSVTEWYRDKLGPKDKSLFQYILPVVGETYDGNLNEWYGFHVHKQHVFNALNTAKVGPVEEGSVGGGTGMIAFGFKGGIGTASRRLSESNGEFTVGVLVQANFGSRHQLLVAGVPVGMEIDGFQPERTKVKDGSVIVVIATDAPLLPHQLERLARRASHGVARTGGMSGNTSGDIFLAFSTITPTHVTEGLKSYTFVDSWQLNPILEATVLATEEAIINALVAAKTMEGIGGKVYGLPHDRLRDVLRQHNRLNE